MEKVLVTGGAGYIGSVLCRLLLKENYFVRVVDNLMYSGESLIELLNHESFEFFNWDIRKRGKLQTFLNDVDHVVHLASIVGDPACARNPKLAKEVNLDASKVLYRISNKSKVRKFVFASTCSNYGNMTNPNEYVDEKTNLRPVSLYAQTKVDFERFLLTQKKENVCKPVCLRFSTVYGLSPRPRFDLTVNEFTKELALGNELMVFGEQFWRPYCHVEDLARSVVVALRASEDKTSFEVFNVGDTSENYRKIDLVNEIRNQIKGAKVKFVQKLEDPRDYKVSFEKIKEQLGFRITKKVPFGITQIKNAILNGLISNPNDPKYKNI